MDYLLALVVALVVGSVGARIAGRRGQYGCLGSIVVGLVGALLGRFVSEATGVRDFWVIDIRGRPFPVFWSILGAAVLVAVLALCTHRRPPPAPPAC
ncbi:MAG: GlsB/YeaQ/YmgE family stress response membrane protein [Myxococcales bacterium]|nr:GlsB/YeaQ/YmgE family stress response membrane protein [Myxococcales bacterium]